MKLYKAFRPEYAILGKIYDTKNYNYGLVIKKSTKDQSNLFNAVIDISKKCQWSFEDLMVICIHHQRKLGHPECGTKNLPNWAIEKLHQDYNHFLANLSNQEISVRFWEHLYENIRIEKWPSRPKRTESAFACKEKNHVIEYLKKHNGNGVYSNTICEIELLEGKGEGECFSGDLNLLDSINEKTTYEHAASAVEDYWSGKKSKNPLIEVLIQGKFKINKILD